MSTKKDLLYAMKTGRSRSHDKMRKQLAERKKPAAISFVVHNMTANGKTSAMRLITDIQESQDKDGNKIATASIVADVIFSDPGGAMIYKPGDSLELIFKGGK